MELFRASSSKLGPSRAPRAPRPARLASCLLSRSGTAHVCPAPRSHGPTETSRLLTCLVRKYTPSTTHRSHSAVTPSSAGRSGSHARNTTATITSNTTTTTVGYRGYSSARGGSSRDLATQAASASSAPLQQRPHRQNLTADSLARHDNQAGSRSQLQHYQSRNSTHELQALGLRVKRRDTAQYLDKLGSRIEGRQS